MKRALFGVAASVCLILSTVACVEEARSEGEDAQLAIVGGLLIDGNEGAPIERSVILVEGNRITHVGNEADTEVPQGWEVIDASGYTVMPGLNDAHVHLMIVGHGVYDEYFPRYQNRLREIMPISARQLLMHGVTTARDLGAPLEDIVWMKNQIESGRMEGPRLFVSGPFLQKSLPPAQGTSYDSTIQDFFRWTIDGADDARNKTQQLVDAGVDLIKVIQVAELTAEERAAIREVAEDAGLHIAIHAGSLEEVRAGVELGATTIEHVGGGREPRREEESIRLMSENQIYWSPGSIVSRVYQITEQTPQRLDDQRLRNDLPADIYEDVRASLEDISSLNYFANADANRFHGPKIMQGFDAGVRILVGTDSGTPMNFHYESTWQDMDLLVQYGMPPMRVISSATRLPALAYGRGHELGTIEPGRLADIIVVDGNPLREMAALQNVIHVVKDGVQYK